MASFIFKIKKTNLKISPLNPNKMERVNRSFLRAQSNFNPIKLTVHLSL